MPKKFFYLGSSIPKYFGDQGVRGNAASKAACARENYFFNSMLEICNFNDGDKFFFVSTGLTSDDGYKRFSEISGNGLACCIVTASHHNVLIKKILQLFSIFSAFHKYLDKNCIIVIYNSAPIYLIPLIFFRFRGYKLVVEVEDFFEANSPKFFIHRFSVFLSAKISNLITISSVGQIKYLPKGCTKKLIRNSGYVLDLPARSQELELFNHNGVKFIYSGGLSRERGIDVLLKVFSSLKFDNVSLVITGDGPLRDEVEHCQLVDKRVHYLGLLDDDAFAWLLSNCDVSVNPQIISISENFPSKITAALSFGLKVISTGSVGIVESDFVDFISVYDGSDSQLENELIDAYNSRLSINQKEFRRQRFLDAMLEQKSVLQLGLKELHTGE